MRKLQNIVSNLGNVLVRQGNVIVVRVEALRSLCASYRWSSCLSTLLSPSPLGSSLASDAWQGPAEITWFEQPRVGTANCFAAALKHAAAKRAKRRHTMIMCRRAAA